MAVTIKTDIPGVCEITGSPEEVAKTLKILRAGLAQPVSDNKDKTILSSTGAEAPNELKDQASAFARLDRIRNSFLMNKLKTWKCLMDRGSLGATSEHIANELGLSPRVIGPLVGRIEKDLVNADIVPENPILKSKSPDLSSGKLVTHFRLARGILDLLQNGNVNDTTI